MGMPGYGAGERRRAKRAKAHRPRPLRPQPPATRRAARAAGRGPRARRRGHRAPRRLRRVRGGRPSRATSFAPRSSKSSRDYANARAVELLEPSPDRVPERCDHDGQGMSRARPGRRCATSASSSTSRRRSTTRSTRLGGLSGYELEPIVPAADDLALPQQDGVLVRRAGRPRRPPGARLPRPRPLGAGAGRARLHARVRAQQRRRATSCATGAPQRGPERLRPPRRRRASCATSSCARDGAPATFSCGWSRAEGDFAADELAAALRERFPRRRCSGRARPRSPRSPHGGETDDRRGRRAAARRSLRACAFSISPEAFFQTNTEMAERLYELAADYAGLERPASASSTSTAASARSASCWRCARPRSGASTSRSRRSPTRSRTRALNEIDNAHFFAGDARTAIRPLAEQAPRPDVVVVDPPRAGLSKKVVRRLLETQPKRIVYVSCNPTTLAPNARQIVDAGFRLVKVRPVDMFPHTPHIECVALFERGGCLTSAAEARVRRRRRPRRRTSRASSRSAAPSWATARCGPTTIRWRAGSRRSPSSRRAAPALEVGVAVLALDRHQPRGRRGEGRRARARARAGSGSGSAPASRTARSASCAKGWPRCARRCPTRRA